METQIDEIVAFSSPPKDPVEIWLQLLNYCKKKRALIQLYAKAPTEEVSYRLNIRGYLPMALENQGNT